MTSFFEKLLYSSRYLTIISVVGSLVASLVVFTKSAILVLKSIKYAYYSAIGIEGFSQEVVPTVIECMDSFLLAIVLVIFAIGIYELFIHSDKRKDDENSPKWLKVKSLDDLKESLGKVILLILIVSFYEASLKISYKSSLELLIFAGGIFLVSISLYLTHKK